MSIVVRYHPTGLTREQYDEVTRRVQEDWPAALDMHVLFCSEGHFAVSEILEF